MEEEGDVVYFEVSQSIATNSVVVRFVLFSHSRHFLILWSRLQTSPAAEQLKEAAGDMSTNIFTSSLNSRAPDTNDSTGTKQVLCNILSMM